MKIKVKSLIEWQLYIVMVVEAFISILHIPSLVRYILDVNMIVLIAFSLCKPRHALIDKEYVKIRNYIVLYMIIFVLLGCFKFVPLGQLLWAVKHNYFYFFFFFVCVAYLQTNDAERIMNRITRLQVFNVLCAIYEYYVMGVKNDYLGGMFGTAQGSNAYLNVYCVVIFVFVLVKYMSKKATLLEMLWIVGSSLFLAALSELKIFYVEIVLIILLAVFLSANFFKGIVVVSIGFFALMLGLNFLATVNADSMQYLNSLEALWEYGSRSDFGSGDIRIARLTSISQINVMFFKDDIWLKLLGYGLGSCEDSLTFAIFNSSFADRYRDIGYRNLTSSMNYLETGLIGLTAFIVIFVWLFLLIQKGKKDLGEYEYVGTFSQIMAAITIFICFYNAAIRRQIAYLTFFTLAYYFIWRKSYLNKGELNDRDKGGS